MSLVMTRSFIVMDQNEVRLKKKKKKKNTGDEEVGELRIKM